MKKEQNKTFLLSVLIVTFGTTGFLAGRFHAQADSGENEVLVSKTVFLPSDVGNDGAYEALLAKRSHFQQKSEESREAIVALEAEQAKLLETLSHLESEIDEFNDELVFSYGTLEETAHYAGGILKDLYDTFLKHKGTKLNTSVSDETRFDTAVDLLESMMELNQLIQEIRTIKDDPEKLATFKANTWGTLLELEANEVENVEQTIRNAKTLALSYEEETESYQRIEEDAYQSVMNILTEDQKETMTVLSEHWGDGSKGYSGQGILTIIDPAKITAHPRTRESD